MAYAENFRNFGLGANNGGSNQINSSNGGVDGYSSMSNEGGLVMGQIGGPHGYPNSSPSAQDALYEELWHACAGPLVTLPKIGERVFYFPQGHMEQVSFEEMQANYRELVKFAHFYQVNSTNLLCDRGYTAPEYAVLGELTEKANVYSYGIMVLEILSGRKCVDATLPGPKYIFDWVWNKYKEGKVLDIVDPKLQNRYPREKALRVITIALLCTQGSSERRPTMSWVASMLNNDAKIRVHPTQPAFVGGAAARAASSTAMTNSATSISTTASHQSAGTMDISLFLL